MADFTREEAAERAIIKAAQERLNGTSPTKTDDSGRTVLEPTFSERMVLSGPGNLNVSDKMSQVQEKLDVMRDTQKAEDYVKTNIDEYPQLSDYEAAGGLAGAKEIRKTEDKLRAGTTRLEDLGLSLETLNSNIGDSGLTALDADSRYTSAQLAPYITQYNDKRQADKRAPELKLLTDRLDEERKARQTSDQRASNAQTDLQEYRLYEGKRRTHEAEQETLRRAHELEVRQAEGKASRGQTFDLAVMQMQNNNADRMYRREADERQSRRDERKDRQLMILQLIKGMQQMGQSFTI